MEKERDLKPVTSWSQGVRSTTVLQPPTIDSNLISAVWVPTIKSQIMSTLMKISTSSRIKQI